MNLSANLYWMYITTRSTICTPLALPMMLEHSGVSLWTQNLPFSLIRDFLVARSTLISLLVRSVLLWANHSALLSIIGLTEG